MVSPTQSPLGTESRLASDAHQSARAAFADGRTRELSWRRDQLLALLVMLEQNEARFVAALQSDMGKPALEGWLTDIVSCRSEIKHTLAHLRSWMKPKRAWTPLVARPGSSRIIPEPLGVVLVIAPWNYPIQLLLNPLVAALSAGNTVVAKPSELAPSCSALLAELLPHYVDGVEVVQGGVDVATDLLAEKFDHVFFTGSTAVGKIVMTAAAQHLTPVTLELGGKSPAIVDSSAKLTVAANRITWGKFLNAGQTCIAPDYVLVNNSIAEQFVDALATSIGDFYGPNPRFSPDLARIIDDRHFARLAGLLSDDHQGFVAIGGDSDPDDRYLAPTVVLNPSPDSALMSEEIFGPILPVIGVDSTEEAIAFIAARPKPLALYAFADDSAVVDRILAKTTSGGACINHTLLQFTVPDLPFGGVGASGLGRYHGRSGFDTFSNSKAVLRKSTWLEHPLTYPPYTDLKRRILKRLV